MNLEEAVNGIGRRVVYTPYKGCSEDSKECGVITSVNSKNVFVRYDNDVNSKSTTPTDLEFEIKL